MTRSIPPDTGLVGSRLRELVARYGLHASVALICLVFSAMLWTGLFVQLNLERKHVIESRRHENDNLVRVFEEHVARTMRAVEITLREIASEYQRYGRKFDLVGYVKDRGIFLDPYNSISVTDKNGDQILSSFPIRKPLNFKNSEDFQFHSRYDTPTLFISKPRQGAISGKWTVYLSLRRNNADGSFAGGTTLGMDPAYFSKTYATLELGKDSVVALIRRDGVVLTRSTNAEVTAGERKDNFNLFTRYLPTADHGSYISAGKADGITRILSYRALKNYPLVVLVGTSMATTLADYDKRKSLYVQAAGIATAVILCLGLFALLQIERSERANAERRRSGRLFRTLADGSPVGIFRTDAAGKCVYVNSRWCEIAGMHREATLGDGWAATLHPDDRERVFKDWEAAANNQQPFLSEYRFQRPDGIVTWVVGQARAETNPQGMVLGYVGTTTDITERKEAEETIRRINTELEQRVKERTAGLEAANKELETFTYSVSHDLKAPLRGIDGYSRLLLEAYATQLDDEGRRFLENIRKSAQQMGDLIDDLLAYSRLERSNRQAEEVNLQELLDTLLAERAAEVQSRGATVTVALPCATVRADQDGLAMALRNLLDNALKFSRDAPQPVIEIGSRNSGTACTLWVRDNGTGFDMKFHDRIFNIFQRLHRAEDYPGTGVGLAIVRKAMERMGGRAWAESEPGKGATFYLEIPK